MKRRMEQANEEASTWTHNLPGILLKLPSDHTLLSLKVREILNNVVLNIKKDWIVTAGMFFDYRFGCTVRADLRTKLSHQQ